VKDDENCPQVKCLFRTGCPGSGKVADVGSVVHAVLRHLTPTPSPTGSTDQKIDDTALVETAPTSWCRWHFPIGGTPCVAFGKKSPRGTIEVSIGGEGN